MKIFMGMYNTASLIDDYSAGFKALGHDVFSVGLHEHALIGSNVDLHVPSLVRDQLQSSSSNSPEEEKYWIDFYRKLAWEKALEADLCFFIWSSFEEDASDLIKLKALGKKVVVRYCGSEVRDVEVDRQASLWGGYPFTDYGLPCSLEILHKKLRYVRMVERYADLVLSVSQLSLRPGMVRGHFLFDSTGILTNTNQRKDKPVVLHAPSRRDTKGTDIWLNAFKSLRNEGLDFTVRLVENIPHEQMLKEYADADIFCNSLTYGGRSAYEAMAAGCVVVERSVAHIKKAIHKYVNLELAGLGLPQDAEHSKWLGDTRNTEYYFTPPIVPATAETVVDSLRDIITDFPKRQALVSAGVGYVEEALSPSAACSKILSVLESPDVLENRAELVLNPFFNLFYDSTEDSPERVALFNEYTDLVSGENWYKRYVQPCKRGGLVF